MNAMGAKKSHIELGDVFPWSFTGSNPHFLLYANANVFGHMP